MIYIFLLLSNFKKKRVRITTFSHYLEHSAPLFKQQDILNFKVLVTQRFSLLIYKIHMENVTLPISNLFMINNLHHNYNARQNIIDILKLGRMKTVITFSVFKVLIFVITFRRKFQ